VLHVTDDTLLLAKAAIGAVGEMPPVRAAERVRGFVLVDSCRHFEFVVKSVDASGERVNIEAEVVHSGRTRDFFGFNRAKHAVVEAAILATRLHFLPLEEVASEFAKLRVIIGKTGGVDEHAAMELLEQRLREAQREANPSPGPSGHPLPDGARENPEATR
jgi:hypothetical protein